MQIDNKDIVYLVKHKIREKALLIVSVFKKMEKQAKVLKIDK